MSWTGVHTTKTTAVNTFVGSLRQAKDQKAWKLDKHHSSIGGPSKRKTKKKEVYETYAVVVYTSNERQKISVSRAVKADQTLTQ